MRLLVITAITMIAFAANSVLGRMALGSGSIDPVGYTLVRLACGAAMLVLLIAWRHGGSAYGQIAAGRFPGTWISAAALFGYAATFSLGFVRIDTGAGTLIQFACVQGTMVGWGIVGGERPAALEWAGLAVAIAAFVWLVSPGISAPDPAGAALMALSGIAWGIYSLRGRAQADPLAATAGNFIRSVPLAIILLALFIGRFEATPFGLLVAFLSGAITSALGYALWYHALKELTATRGAIVQLTVPVIAAAGGIAFLDEVLTPRFVLCSALILGGVAIAILARRKS